jgi:hypothetical protein
MYLVITKSNENFMQRLSAALHGTLGSYLCRRAVLMLWQAFLFLGLRLSSLFSSFYLVVSTVFLV